MKNYNDFTSFLSENFRLDPNIFQIEKHSDNIDYVDGELINYRSSQLQNEYFSSFRKKLHQTQHWSCLELQSRGAQQIILNDLLSYHAGFLNAEDEESIQMFIDGKRETFSIGDDNNTLAYLVGHKRNNTFCIDIAKHNKE